MFFRCDEKGKARNWPKSFGLMAPVCLQNIGEMRQKMVSIGFPSDSVQRLTLRPRLLLARGGWLESFRILARTNSLARVHGKCANFHPHSLAKLDGSLVRRNGPSAERDVRPELVQ